jgi:hypothetical protein
MAISDIDLGRLADAALDLVEQAAIEWDRHPSQQPDAFATGYVATLDEAQRDLLAAQAVLNGIYGSGFDEHLDRHFEDIHNHLLTIEAALGSPGHKRQRTH